jgi:hypothetical protein
MKIDRNSLIAGQPARKVRDLLRRLGESSMNVEGFAERLAVSQAKARHFVVAMLELRLLERCGPYPHDRAPRARACGRDNLNWLSQLGFGWTEVRQRLKARNPYLKFHSSDEIESLGVATVRIYPRAGEPVSRNETRG